ncbi:MAG: hypothetical protein Q4P66_00655 [Actinomycetaceae bacterium]|nr:hypothetical protein [Actinomycetaceae bacterium]
MATWLHRLNPFGLLRHRLLVKYPIDYRIFKRVCRVQRLGELQSPHVFRAYFLERSQATSLNELITDPQSSTFLTELSHALNTDCRVWIFHTDDEGYQRLQSIFGDHIIRHIERFGGRLSTLSTTPYALRPLDIAQSLFAQWDKLSHHTQKLVRHALEGVDTKYIGNRLTHILEDHQISYTHRSWLARLLRNPRFIAYVIVFLYSTLRVLPVALIEEFKGDLGLLWTIDVVTALPYTWGVLAMVTARTRFRRFLGMIVTVITFIAPYIYFWLTGDNYPPWVIAVVGALIASGILLEAFKYIHEKTLVSQLQKAKWNLRV